MYHTLGQRKGLGIGGLKDSGEDPWYTVDKDLTTNRLIVAQGHNHPSLFSTGLIAQQLHWVDRNEVTEPFRCTVKTRYRQQDIPCSVVPLGPDRLEVRFDEPVAAVTPGSPRSFIRAKCASAAALLKNVYRTNRGQKLL